MSTNAIPPLIAITADPDVEIHPDVLSSIAASFQKQVNRDFSPYWGKTATIGSWVQEENIPKGYWKIIIKNELDEPGAEGYHTKLHRQPIAYVRFEVDPREIAVTVSHEGLEMLADQSGNRTVVCTVPDGRRAEVLVEACDPCESFTYLVDGIPMSDFVLPRYYGPHHWSHSVHPGPETGRITFLNTVAYPLNLARGGYLSYVVDDVWWQDTWFGGSEPKTRELGRLPDEYHTVREWIDKTTREARQYVGKKADD